MTNINACLQNAIAHIESISFWTAFSFAIFILLAGIYYYYCNKDAGKTLYVMMITTSLSFMLLFTATLVSEDMAIKLFGQIPTTIIRYLGLISIGVIIVLVYMCSPATNAIKIPDLQPMLRSVIDFVKENQGEKGFILTDDTKADAIYDFEYSYEENRADEFHVKAVRVKNNDLQILTDLYNVRYEEQDVKEAKDEQWNSVQFDDIVYFTPTIFNIAENIQEYVEN